MPTISNKETALLMLLSEGPMHAYQVEQVVKDRDMRLWTEISMSSIYKLLKKLKNGNLIKSRRQDTENGITKNVFSLTAAGRRALKLKIRDILTEPEHIRWRMDLATSHLSILSRQEALKCLETYRLKLMENIKCYQELHKYLLDHNCPVHSCALATRPQYLMEGEIRWVESYVKILNLPPK
jgi:DNA-binding PadR family transcriptional regulator